MDRFKAADAHVMGVSVDSVPCNEAWAKSLGGVAYPLASDFWPHGAMLKAYGVLGDGGMADRAVVVVGPDGLVEFVHVYGAAELPEPDEVLAALKQPAKR